jgi:hypothetical protein
VAYFIFVAVMLSISTSRGVFDYLGAIMGCSMLLLLALSVIFLFIDRRQAIRGFLVVFIGFVIATLFPAL